MSTAAKSGPAPVAKSAKPAAELAQVTILPKSRFHYAEHARNTWRVVLDEKTPYADVFDVRFWIQVEAGLTAGDLLEVLDDGNTFFALLYVRKHARAAGIELVELFRRDMKADQPMELEGWRAEFRGPQLRWCVIDPSGVVRRDGLHNFDAASVALNQFVATHIMNPVRIVG